MDFLFLTQKSESIGFKVSYVERFDPTRTETNTLYIEKLDHLDYIESKGEAHTILFGDVIEYDASSEFKAKGFFYQIRFSPSKQTIEFAPDLHNFLPIYYTEHASRVIISSSIDWLLKILPQRVYNPSFVTDIALFNGPLGSTCIIKSIHRLEYGRKLLLTPTELAVTGKRRIYDYFLKKPVEYKKALDGIVDRFIENCSQYLKGPCAISLTGGFDGRTIVAVAHSFRTEFSAYSYGKIKYDDVSVPAMLSQKLGFPYELIDLAEGFIEVDHLPSVREYLSFSGGMNGFLYPQAHLAAKHYAKRSLPLITGYCGSELLRNAHSAGTMTSTALVDLVAQDYQLALQSVNSSPAIALLGPEYLNNGLVVSSLKKAEEYVLSLPDWLNNNQKLAVFVFEEALPKLFGTWVYAGMHYSRIRVPFMDNNFFYQIIQTKVSQVYRSFLENNPFKRFYGQLLYSKIIDKTWPELGHYTSDKHYAPADLLNIAGRLKVAYGYIGKKKRIKRINYDNLGLVSGALKYIKTLEGKGIKTLLDDDLTEQMYKNVSVRDMILLKLSVDEYKRIYNLL